MAEIWGSSSDTSLYFFARLMVNRMINFHRKWFWVPKSTYLQSQSHFFASCRWLTMLKDVWWCWGPSEGGWLITTTGKGSETLCHFWNCSFWNIPTFEVTITWWFLPCAEVGKISLRTLEGFDALELGNQLSFKLQPPCKLRIHVPDSTWRVLASNFEMHLAVFCSTLDVNAIVAERWTLWSGADSVEITLSWPGIWHVWTMTIHDIYQPCISMLDFIPQGIIIHSLNSLDILQYPFVARILMNFGYITKIDPDVLPSGYW
jgi:hypothetical protein